MRVIQFWKSLNSRVRVEGRPLDISKALFDRVHYISCNPIRKKTRIRIRPGDSECRVTGWEPAVIIARSLFFAILAINIVFSSSSFFVKIIFVLFPRTAVKLGTSASSEMPPDG